MLIQIHNLNFYHTGLGEVPPKDNFYKRYLECESSCKGHDFWEYIHSEDMPAIFAIPDEDENHYLNGHLYMGGYCCCHCGLIEIP